MYSDEIYRFLGDRVRDFDGVFSIDNLPDDPNLLVYKTDPSDKPGRHRVTIYIEDAAENFSIRLDVDLTLTLNVI